MNTNPNNSDLPATAAQCDQATRLQRVMRAPPEVLANIDRILDGMPPTVVLKIEGPPLLSLTSVAQVLGVCRQTVYRLLKNGHLPRVEIRPGVYRIRRVDLEALLAGKGASAFPEARHLGPGQAAESTHPFSEEMNTK